MPPSRAGAVEFSAVLSVLMVAAWILAAAHGLMRPLFQVSDELSYVHTVQARALELGGGAERSCIAPPRGETLVFPLGGGKFGFHAAAGSVLLKVCRTGAGPASLVWTRLVLALTLPLLVSTTWLMARLVVPGSTFVPAAAAVLTAFQPVLTTFSGGITPDGPANAASAIALLAACHLLLDGGAARWAAIHMLAALVAIASKDSALFLAPLGVLVLLTWVTQHGARALAVVFGLLVCGAAGIAHYDLLTRLATPFPGLDRVLMQGWSTPGVFFGAILQALVGNAGMMAWSGLGQLANFGGGNLPLPTSFFVVQAATLGLGAAGVIGRLTGANSSTRRLRAFVAFAIVAMILEAVQVPVRQMMTNSLGPIQGRWLFPIWSLLAVLVALGLEWVFGQRAVRWLPGLTLLWAATALAALVRVVDFYYVDWPRTYDWPHLFLLAGEGHEAGSAAVRVMIDAAAAPAPARHLAVVASIGIAITTVIVVTRAFGFPSAPRREPHHE